ncbi:MAG: zinc ribbon domain-containing protein [Lachnospiraceae bacterium]|nr:zinc ribbon domain-containing protein [Lachnospiraceae bacterium]
MFCSKCGSDIGNNSFCPNCGTSNVPQGGSIPKTNLGVSAGLLVAGVYFSLILDGGVIAALLIAGYVLIAEKEEWLRKNVVKAIILYFAFALLYGIIRLIPNFVDWIQDWVYACNGSFNTSKFYQIMAIITDLIQLIQKVMFIVFGIFALSHKNFNVPVADGVAQKHC